MSLRSLCRVCLANNGTKIIINTKLQFMFEKLTRNQLMTDDGRPELLCYICHSLLQKCFKFVEMSDKSEDYLNKILQYGNEFFDEKPKLPQAFHAISMSKMSLLSIHKHDEDYDHCKMNIKTEPRARKVEIDMEDAYLDAPTDEKYKTETNSLEQQSDPSDKKCLVAPKREAIKSEKPSEHKTKINKDGEAKLPIKFELEIDTKAQPGKGYKCDKCPKYYKQKAYLKRHRRIHTGERPYPCNICNEMFTDSVIRNQHVKTHTGEAPYVCNICSKPFNLKPHLTEHIRIHTGEKPHSCDKCPSKFAHKSALIRHNKVHTGEKPYLCERCPKRFSQTSNLRKHLRRCKVEKEKCTMCEIRNLKM